MSEKKDHFALFCYHEIPGGEDVLALLGADCIHSYGHLIKGEYSAQKHFHNLMEICICRQGRGEMLINGRKYPYEAGCLAVIPKNIPHTIISEKGEKSFWEYLYINPSLFEETIGILEKREREQLLDLIELYPFFKGKEEAPFLASEVNLIMDQVRTQGYGYRQCIRGLTHALLMETAKLNHMRENRFRMEISPGNDKTQKIARALDYISAHYTEKIRVTDLADAAFISSAYLRKLFMEYCGMSPMQYLNYVRIHAACRMLRKTDDNINEVARKAGFENMATFINNFKLYVGETPRQWKEKQKPHD